jgi:hypothetical protein
VEATEKKKEPLSAKFRESFEKFFSGAYQVDRGRSGAVTDHHFPAGIKREGFASQLPFFFRSE